MPDQRAEGVGSEVTPLPPREDVQPHPMTPDTATPERKTPPHPAKFSDSILPVVATFLRPGWRVLDPFAGTGRVHLLADLIGVETVGVELEPEWATMHPQTIQGNALALPANWTGTFDAVVTSPTYGNRMADSHDAKERCRACNGTGSVRAEGLTAVSVMECGRCDGQGKRDYKRLTYRHQLGRPLHPDNSGQLQWGPKYQAFHVVAWREALRVLRPGGRLIINVSNHIRAGVEVDVAGWHSEACEALGFERIAGERVDTKRMGFGANRDARVDGEVVLVFRKASS